MIATVTGILAGTIALPTAGYTAYRGRNRPLAVVVALGLGLVGLASLVVSWQVGAPPAPLLGALAGAFGATAVMGRSLEDVEDGD